MFLRWIWAWHGENGVDSPALSTHIRDAKWRYNANSGHLTVQMPKNYTALSCLKFWLKTEGWSKMEQNKNQTEPHRGARSDFCVSQAFLFPLRVYPAYSVTSMLLMTTSVTGLLLETSTLEMASTTSMPSNT